MHELLGEIGRQVVIEAVKRFAMPLYDRARSEIEPFFDTKPLPPIAEIDHRHVRGSYADRKQPDHNPDKRRAADSIPRPALSLVN